MPSPALVFAQLATAAFTKKFWQTSPLCTTLAYDPPAGLLTGRTVLVTGANAGLGLETAVHLARLQPAKLVMACRSLDRGAKAKEVLCARGGIEPGRVEVWELDMASFESVKAFAARCASELDRLDIACLNAGITGLSWKQTKDGWEETFQINNLSTGLLGVLLLPTLAKYASVDPGEGSQPFKPHLSIVGSLAHETIDYVRPDATCSSLLADLNDPASRNTTKRYQFTKLVSIFLAHKLSSLPTASEVVVNVPNPGLCRTEIFHEAPGWLTKCGLVLAWEPEDGAKNIAWACVSDTPSGSYVEGTAVGRVSAFARSEDGLQLERDLWAEMKQVWLEAAPEASKVLE